ncbi:MAG: DNA polymerase III subunit alpha [Streptomycetales bacterium]
MSDRFVHLHVASGYSLRYGASHPGALVERAADHGMGALALTDRDGVYGAVKFVKACMAADIRPILGVDLAVMPVCVPESGAGYRPGRRTPARGGATVDPRHPRVTLLAQDPGGWAALCRLVSSTHLAGERGKPVTTVDLVADHAGSGGVFVLLGPDSEVGRALAVRRPDLARAALHRWCEAVAAEDLLIEVVSHRGPGEGRYSSAHAARMFRFAQGEHLTAVLTNAVRYADRSGGPVADVLDAARQLVTLDIRQVDRVNAEGHLKSGKEMADIAEEITRLSGEREALPAGGSGGGQGTGSGLLAATRRVAERCALDPRGGLGIGVPHFPELDVVLGATGRPPAAALRERCEAGLTWRGLPHSRAVVDRLEHELAIIEGLGYPSYFLTVADVVALIRDMGVRCAARGSGAGSLVNYLLGVSGVDPLAHGLLMERFLSPLREALPDIDVDVESARRTEIYERILERYGVERCSCLSMMDTYRARHAIRDVGAALGMPPAEIDSIAKAFPHIRAQNVRAALRELPELRASGIGEARFDVFFRLVERLDGLPRHIALHPCGVLLSDTTLLDRTPVEASWLGFPMSQFDKDDAEDLGLLKLDVLGVRMQSAMSHALKEVERVEGRQIDLDAVPRDDPATFRLVRSTRTLGCFQIESPGQRELLGKFAPETFDDLIIDISLFRPGPVKSDMVTPFLSARQGWEEPRYRHSDLRDVLRETHGVVVFHEQVLRIVETLTGCGLAEADELRRALGEPAGQPRAETWFRSRARARGYDPPTIDRVWEVLKAFGSFGFCKAHAAAFALPTYHSAWLKAHHPAAFLAGVLTHDPGMYPKRLILDDARQFGIAVLPLDVNGSDADYRVEKTGAFDEPPPEVLGQPPRAPPEAGLPDGRAYGIRLGLSDVRGVSDAEVARIVAGRPYFSLSDFWHRTAVSRPVTERLVVAGGFDALYGIGSPVPVRRRDRLTRRDLLLQVAELDRWTRATRVPGRRRKQPAPGQARTDSPDVRARAARQSRGASPVELTYAQLALDLGDTPGESAGSGLPEMTGAERVRAELEVVGLDVSRHIVDFYTPVLDALGVTRSRELLHRRARTEILVAGVKVATQTPPVRSGRRVVFVTLDDATGPVDATFFEDDQGPYAATLFHGWLLLIRGYIRRTGPRGVSLRATGCWELPGLHEAWEVGGIAAVEEFLDRPQVVTERAIHGAAQSHALNPVVARPVLVHPSGYRQSPYADTRPPGDDVKSGPPRKLWHSSPGSAGG